MIPAFVSERRAEWIRFLAILDDRARKHLNMSQSAIAGEMQQEHLLSEGRKWEGAWDDRETVRVLSELRRKYIAPLLKEGWISIEGQRRSARLKLTDQGQRMLNVFSPVFIMDK